MVTLLLLDNDVLIKCSCYALLALIDRPAGAEPDGVLGAAPYVVRYRLDKNVGIKDRVAAKKRFEQYLGTVEVLEPSEAEAALSSEVENAAAMLGAELDEGESLLFAIAILRGSCSVLTGDKRAIEGAERLQGTVTQLSELRGRLVCLEQAIHGIAIRSGAARVRGLICAEPHVDKSLSICFACSSGTAVGFDLTGLVSYVSDLRRHAPTLLLAENHL